jgi:hypothetical protein
VAVKTITRVVVQNSDGTWDNRPTSSTTEIIPFVRIVARVGRPSARGLAGGERCLRQRPDLGPRLMAETLGGAWVLTPTGWARGDAGPTPPASSQTMLLGANVPSINSWAEWTARGATVGAMGVRRCYNTGMPATWAASAAAPTSGHGIVNWLSVRPDAASMASGALDAAVTSFVNSIPAGEQVMLTPLHEPENNTGTVPAATWVAAVQRFYDVAKAARPSTKIGPVLMGYTFDPKSGRKVSDWNVGAAHCDFYGIDFYNGYHYPLTGNSNTWNPPVGTQVVNFQAFCDSIGKPGAVGEFASSEDQTGIGPQRKIDWTTGYLNYAHTHGWLAMCWFDSYKPGDTDPSMVLDSTPEFTAFWRGQTAAHPARGF